MVCLISENLELLALLCGVLKKDFELERERSVPSFRLLVILSWSFLYFGAANVGSKLMLSPPENP